MDWYAVPPPIILGHRGASAAMPENTLAAFALAAEQGAHGVELDVRLSADGNVIVMHDATVDRTTDGHGPVARMDTAALRALDAGQGQQVPTLDDVFQAFGPALLYNVELKSGSLFDAALAIAVADRVEAYHLENQVVVSSFNPFLVWRARRYFSRTTMLAVLWDRGPRWLYHAIAPVAANHPHHSLVDESYMAWAREHGYRVHVWTVDDPEEAQRLVRLGVDGIITNRPQVIRDALAVT